MLSTASVVPRLCAAWTGIWFSAAKRVFLIISTLPRWTVCPPSLLLSLYCGCFLGGIWLGHRWANHLHLMLRLRNYTYHPTICHHVVDWDSIVTLSSLSLQFFVLVSGRIPQLHILTSTKWRYLKSCSYCS